MNAGGAFCQLRQVLRVGRTVHTTCIGRASAYDGPGKTTVTFISKEVGISKLLITNCNELGFALNNGAHVIGPMALFPKHALSWNVRSGRHINEGSLSLFGALEPRPDILIVGLDELYDFAYLRSLSELVRGLGLAAEILHVRKACSVFNFINEEGRYAVAALIPPRAPEPRLRLARPRRAEPRERIADGGAASGPEDAKR